MYYRQVAFKHENSPAGMTHLCGQLVAPVRERVQIGLDNSPFGCLVSRRAEFLSPRQFLLRITFVMNYMIVDIIPSSCLEHRHSLRRKHFAPFVLSDRPWWWHWRSACSRTNHDTAPRSWDWRRAHHFLLRVAYWVGCWLFEIVSREMEWWWWRWWRRKSSGRVLRLAMTKQFADSSQFHALYI